MLVVTTADWRATSGRLQRYEREAAGWVPVGAPVDVVVGRNGLGWGRGLHASSDARPDDPAKREGDGRAPAGVFRLTAAFGYGTTEPTGLPYLPTDADVECVDDTASVAYNTVRERTTGADWTSHEEMRRGDGLYRIGVVVAHNGPGVDDALVPGGSADAVRTSTVRGGGSCIFLHVWNGPGSTTSGCTAMPDASLQAALAWLDDDADPVLVQLPRPGFDRLRTPWALPDPGASATRGGR
jgi:L,D-peptidoglycan transpeptidase YkuD (ErfK/YbiS/YcfS/YnhG family)